MIVRLIKRIKWCYKFSEDNLRVSPYLDDVRDYTEVEVLTNSTDESFVGRKFFIVSNAKTDGTVYELFTDAGTTSAGIFVTITTV